MSIPDGLCKPAFVQKLVCQDDKTSRAERLIAIFLSKICNAKQAQYITNLFVARKYFLNNPNLWYLRVRVRVSRISCVRARRACSPLGVTTHTGPWVRGRGAFAWCPAGPHRPLSPIPKCINDTRNTRTFWTQWGQSIGKKCFPVR